MKKGVIYARYSAGPNQREESIEGQIRECTRFAKQSNIEIIGSYADRGVSGRSDKRVYFQQMLRDAEKKKFECVIVWKIDRFGRNREEIALNKIRCRKSGVEILYATEHIPEGPTGILLESMLEGLAEFYSAQLSQNILRGLTENALQGKAINGSACLGYKIDKDKKYVVDELEAAVVRRIFNMFAEGFKYSEIEATLNELRLKTKRGGQYNKNSISRILKNEKYIGVFRWRDIVIEDGIPAIIDKELFCLCQEKIKMVKSAPGGGRAKVPYLLTAKLYCGYCESSMIGESGNNRHGNTFNYYKCSSRKNHKNCEKETVKKEWIEQFVVRAIYDNVLSNEAVIESIAEAAVRVQSNENSALESLELQLADATRSLNNLIKLAEGMDDPQPLAARIVELDATKTDLEFQIEKEKLPRIILTKEQIIYWLTHLRDLDMSEADVWRKIINTFIHAVFLYDDKIIITANYEDKHGDFEKITINSLNLDEQDIIKVPQSDHENRVRMSDTVWR